MEKYNESNALQTTIRMIQRLLLCAGLCLSPLASSAENTLAVWPPQNQASPSLGDQSDAIAQIVTESLFKTKRFILIERGQLSKLIDEAKVQHTGIIDDTQAVELGKQSGARHIIVGSYNGEVNHIKSQERVVKGKSYNTNESFPSNLSVNLRIVDVQTGKIEKTFSAQAAGNGQAPAFSTRDALQDLAVKLGRVIANAYPSSGLVIKMLSEKEYVINNGKANHIEKGDEFSLIEQGEDIIDPNSGEVYQGEKKILGDGEVTQVDEKTSILKVSNLKQPVILWKTRVEAKEKTKGWLERFTDFGK